MIRAIAGSVPDAELKEWKFLGEAVGGNAHIEVIRYLLKAGFDPNLDSPLNHVAQRTSDHEAVIQLLVDYGATVDRGWGWESPLMWVCNLMGQNSSTIATIRGLLRNGADPSRGYESGQSSIQRMQKIVDEWDTLRAKEALNLLQEAQNCYPPRPKRRIPCPLKQPQQVACSRFPVINNRMNQ